MPNRSFLAENRQERERIQSLVERLTDVDMARPLSGGWTVSAALSHLAFTDRLWLEKFGEWERTGTVRLPDIDQRRWDAMIDALLPWWLARDFVESRREVVAAAEAVDQKIETLSDIVLEQILALRPRTAIRAMHRRAHLAEIESILNSD
jgi:uncharacterized damage-inducible protein DinB